MSEYHARGGRKATAALTPEERARRNRKAARTLGKEGRKARSAKGWETRRKAAEKPKRPLPKTGTMNAAVLAAVTEEPASAREIYVRGMLIATGEFDLVCNALSSLRSAGHVVSEPKPGSRREKLWRLA